MTGYTSYVEYGKISTLRDFALECATAFFYDCDSIQNRSDCRLGDIVIYKQHLEKETAKLSKLIAMTDDEKREYGRNDLDRLIRMCEIDHADRLQRIERLKAMLEKVTAWEPGEDHLPLKEFMLNQLNGSLDFENIGDTSGEYINKLKTRDPMEIYYTHLQEAKKNIEYYQEELKKAKKHQRAVNKWIKNLLSSLPPKEESDDD